MSAVLLLSVGSTVVRTCSVTVRWRPEYVYLSGRQTLKCVSY